VRGHLARVPDVAVLAALASIWPLVACPLPRCDAPCALLPTRRGTAAGPFVCQHVGLLALTYTITSRCDAVATVASTLRPPAPCPPLRTAPSSSGVRRYARTSPCYTELAWGASCYHAHVPPRLGKPSRTHPLSPHSSATRASGVVPSIRPVGSSFFDSTRP
jgi:hypothetical protein